MLLRSEHHTQPVHNGTYVPYRDAHLAVPVPVPSRRSAQGTLRI